MATLLVTNWIWITVILISVAAIIYAVTKLQKPVPEVPTTKSADFSADSIVSNPVSSHQWVNVFREAAQAAIGKDKVNPWIYLTENWEKTKDFGGSVEMAMLDFITNEANRQIPDSSNVSLSIRDYSNQNSVIMEYRDPKTDSIMVTTGHDPEPCLYATFANKKGESKTFKLLCANGLVGELGGLTTAFEDDHEIQSGESFIAITGSTPAQAVVFAEENNLPVRFILEGFVASKTPNFSKTKVYKDFAKRKKGIFDVVLQPGDILRKKNGKWLYIVSTTTTD